MYWIPNSTADFVVPSVKTVFLKSIRPNLRPIDGCFINAESCAIPCIVMVNNIEKNNNFFIILDICGKIKNKILKILTI